MSGYWNRPDRKQLRIVISSTWNIPDAAAEALLSKKSPFTIEGETVVFEA